MPVDATTTMAAEIHDLRGESDRRFDVQIRSLRQDVPELAADNVDRLRRYRHTLPDEAWIGLAHVTAEWTRQVTAILDAHTTPTDPA